ncbi:hypothetical protein CH300_16935 [Rhodococcus sp. 15-1154-1]|nr:hypothetical protein [Rhodococcus sp. 15-1154-1]OZF02523.1 hypothetical protein CH300_16935 [Rhodococcus sp. 15-1154-1]
MSNPDRNDSNSEKVAERKLTKVFVVRDIDTARALGSGSLEVLGTPRVLAWFEEVSVGLVADHLEPGTTTVGTSVQVNHVAASAVGANIHVTITEESAAGRSRTFSAVATDDKGTVVATGIIERAVVSVERFLGRLR